MPGVRSRSHSSSRVTFALWFLVAGLVLTVMAVSATVVKRLPLSTAQIYAAVGLVLGPLGFGLLAVDPVAQATFLEHLTEVAAFVSLFAAGLKLRVPLSDGRWRIPLRLATVSMALGVAGVAALGVWGLGLSVGAAVLLGAILAPTDPVLASDVQVSDAEDRDRLRFGLTGEAGLNDGTAFPFVLLGLGLMGLHDLGPSWAAWLGVDVLWATAGALAIGAGLGVGVGRFVIYLRKTHKESAGTDDYLALGLIALTVGLSLLAHTYAFLAVFVAGVALRWEERRHTGESAKHVEAHVARGDTEAATHEEAAPAVMAESVLHFTEQIDRIASVAVVVLLGALVHLAEISWAAAGLVGALFFVVRPLSVWAGLLGSGTSPVQRGLTAWFGIRGIGSLYYLFYAISHGVGGVEAERLTGLVLAVVAVGVVLHGVSVTPLMTWYARRAGREERVARAA